MGAFEHHGVPPYLTAVVRDYFRDRVLVYLDRDGTVRERDIKWGVPQDSVLGPLLWNLTYDQPSPLAAVSSATLTTH